MVYRIIIVHISTSTSQRRLFTLFEGILHFLKGSDMIMLLEIVSDSGLGIFP